MTPARSIRHVLAGLCVLSVLVASALAGFGLLGMDRQLKAARNVAVLEQVITNHNQAHAFIDSVRTDVLRALQAADDTNMESTGTIRSELAHHIDVLVTAIAANQRTTLPLEFHESYERIAGLLPAFVAAGRKGVELALADPAAGAANFERFRSVFSALQAEMDTERTRLEGDLQRVRREASLAAKRAHQMIVASLVGGIALLGLTGALAVRIAHSITSDLASSQEEAHRLALHDTLTGLPNRAFMTERLEEDLARVKREDIPLAMLCLDLDRFKQVNDTLGHSVGDVLLRAVAGRLRDCVRRSDTVARLGGDEFAIVQSPLTSLESAATLARRIVAVLSEPYDLGEHQVIIGASVGVSLAPDDAMNAESLLKMADMALYRAKADGRGTYCFFEPEMDSRLQGRRRLELDLRQAVGLQEFELYYQPIIDMPSGRICAMEALVRWRHRERGLVLPGQFIPLAEETGLIVPIGTSVLRQACLHAAAWSGPIRVAVNVSAAQFKGSGLVDAVADALAEAGLPPERLELEITESALLVDANATLTILRELRAMGVRIAMDDFGTGYSSLGYLRSFPFDKIKIDQSFVRDIETSPDCKAIVRAVTSLGSNLGIVTTAEGVETMAQLDQLRIEGCDQVQGYLFSRPVPAVEVERLLDQQRCPAPAPADHLAA